MENQNQSSLSLLALLPNGKVENDVRITDKVVTGICTVYVKRTDDEKEFLLREIGVALLDGNNLTEAVRIAINEAYNAAIRHIAGATPAEPQQPQVSEKINIPEAKSIVKMPVQEPTNDKADILKNSETNIAADTVVDNIRPSVDLGAILDTLEKSPAGSAQKTENSAAKGGIERIEFGGSLFPASDLIQPTDSKNNGNTDDDVDLEYKNALDMEITIFGKLHDCNGWKAGKILNERPDVIVDFCNRNNESYDGPKYTGPRVDQKESLFKLYPDAVRKTQKAA